MSAGDSVTVWIDQLKAGNHDAAQLLWDRYFRDMVRLARARLQGFAGRAQNEEDVALSAFGSFCKGAENGRFPQLRDHDNLWPLLVVITARKAVDARQHEKRQKRGGGNVQGESAWLNAYDGDGGINLVIGSEPTPDFAAEVAEEAQRLLTALGSDELRAVAQWKMEGYSNQEIAAKLGCVERTVERRLNLIRGLLEKEMKT